MKNVTSIFLSLWFKRLLTSCHVSIKLVIIPNFGKTVPFWVKVSVKWMLGRRQTVGGGINCRDAN